ncbi:MAG: toprim domain-containing protein [Alphaproteobacteria bacterium]
MMTDQYTMPAIDQFRDAMTQKGLTPPAVIETDGQIHRFSSSGKRGDDAGWYVFHDGAIAIGSFGDFRTGQGMKAWKADIGRSLTPVEQSDIDHRQKELQGEREVKKQQLQSQARLKASGVARTSIPALDSHPYLIRKNIGAHGIGVWENPDVAIQYSKKTGKPFLQVTAKNGGLKLGFGLELGTKSAEEIIESWKSVLLIPMYDSTGKLQSFQFISKDGDKKFLYGGMMQGCCFPLGEIKNEPTILIAEGYATAATIHEITGYPVVVAYNAGNLLAVAKLIRAQRPDAEIILCADDDWKTKGNPGRTKAEETALAVGGKVIVPEFGENRPDGATDFNDMATLDGKVAVTNFFTRHSLGRKNNMTQNSYDNDNDEAYASFSRPGATTQPEPSPENSPTSGRVFTGTITNFGPAPYKKNPNNSASYFITVANGNDEKTLWGVDLGKALVESGFTVGDKVAIYDKGKVPVQVVTKTRDPTGKVIREEIKTVNKGSWHIGSLDEYIESRMQMAQEMACDEPVREPDAGRAQREAAAASKHPSAPRSSAYRPAPEPVAEPKLHFSDNQFRVVQEIWKDVPRQAASHSEAGYDILLDNKSKVRVTHDRIEMVCKPKQRPDAAYIAACEHARHFWNSEIEVHGDIQHRIKAYAYAAAYGVKVMNYMPNDSELIEVNKIVDQLYKEEEPGFRRPASVRPQAGGQFSPLIR